MRKMATQIRLSPRVPKPQQTNRQVQADPCLPRSHQDPFGMLPTLRMSTRPPLARDRLIGLADSSKNLAKSFIGKPFWYI
jgi:hypothetical protein